VKAGISSSWDMLFCRLVAGYWCFGGAYLSVFRYKMGLMCFSETLVHRFQNESSFLFCFFIFLYIACTLTAVKNFVPGFELHISRVSATSPVIKQFILKQEAELNREYGSDYGT
jgi:hypothetical protein